LGLASLVPDGGPGIAWGPLRYGTVTSGSAFAIKEAAAPQHTEYNGHRERRPPDVD